MVSSYGVQVIQSTIELREGPWEREAVFGGSLISVSISRHSKRLHHFGSII